MRVFLHIGSHKTGTTAIQEFASENADWLRDQGLLYPSFDLIGGKRERSHLGLVQRIMDNNTLPETEDPRRLLASARQNAEHAGCNLMFSAESLFRLTQAQFETVSDLFAEVFSGLPFTIVCSLRSRAEFAESLYRNSYRAFSKVPEDFPAWIERSLSSFEYERIVLGYVQRLGADTLLLPYSKANRDAFVPLFFGELGVDIVEAGKTQREKNPSLDVIDCLAKKLVMNDVCDERMSRAYNNFAAKNQIVSDYAFLDQERESAFSIGFQAENTRLVALAPQLDEVLGVACAPMSKMAINPDCWVSVKARAQDFWDSRPSKSGTRRMRA